MSKTENKLASGAILVDFSISVWSGRRQAKNEAAEVTTKAKAVKDAAAVSKHLMVGTSELGAVQSAGAEIRRFINYYTLPWSDSGTRLLPMKAFDAFTEGLDTRIKKFNETVEALLVVYPTLVSAQAFKLGSMFNRADYPKTEVLRSKFGVHVRMLPVPDTGHYILDAHTEVVQKLQDRAMKDQQASINSMMKDAWRRLYDALKKLEGVVTPHADGKFPRVHESTMTGLFEVTGLLTAFNIDNDPDLENARQRLEQLLSGVSVSALRDDDLGTLRDDVREKTQAILNKFDFGVGEDEDEENT